MHLRKISIILLFILLWFINPILSALLILIISFVYPFKPLIFLFGILLSIYFGLISYSIDVVGDFLNYKENIASVINNGLDFSIRGGEFGYYIIVFVLSCFLNDSIEITHLVMLVIANVVFFMALFNVNYRLSIFIFFLVQLFSVLVINPYLSRQFLAVSFILYSLSINKGKSFLWFLSILIHFSSLIYIMILITSRRILNSKKCFFVLIFLSVFLFLTMNLEVLKIIISQSFLPEFINVKADFYLRMNDSNQKIDVIVLFFCFYTFYIKYRSLNISCSKKDENIINLFFISSILCFSFINLPILPTRVGFLTYYLSPLLLIIVWKINHNIVNILFLIFCILMAAYKIYLNDFAIPWVLLSDGEILKHNFLYYINRL